MIEFCSLKFMIAVTFAIIVCTFLIIALENYNIPENEHLLSNSSTKNASSAPCWETEEFFIKQHCFPCTKFEKVSKHLPACELSGLKEMVSCKISGDVYRSCFKATYYEEGNFYIFEACMAGLGLIGSFIVSTRRKELDKRMMARIQQQISAGV